MNIDTVDRRIDALINLTEVLYKRLDPSTAEARLLHVWSVQSLDDEDQRIKAHLFRRVVDAVDEQITDTNNAAHLKALFAKVCGPGAVAATVPLCNPRPQLVFKDCLFAFSGRFSIPRKQCARLTEGLGGRFSARVTRQVRYLVVGRPHSGWAFGSHGRKIERAMRYREQGDQDELSIISEMHWQTSANWLSKSRPLAN